MENTSTKSSSHAVFPIRLHLVLVTKYRRKVLTEEMRAFMKETFVDILDSRRCHLIEFGGEDDHVHLLLEIHPALDISQLVNDLKSASSRRVRGQCKDHIATFYWKPLFWNRAYYIGSIGSVSLETVRRYVQQQGTKEKETKVTKATTKPSP